MSKAEDASPNTADNLSAISADELKKVIDTSPEQERLVPAAHRPVNRPWFTRARSCLNLSPAPTRPGLTAPIKGRIAMTI